MIICALAGCGLSAQNLEYVTRQVEILASDSMAGRGYVDSGMARAAGYLQQEFERIGLAPVAETYQQPFTYGVNTFPQKSAVQVGNVQLLEGEDYLIMPESGSDRGEFVISWIDSADVAGKVKNIDANSVAVVRTGEMPPKDLQEFIEQTLQKSPVILLTNKKLTWSVGRSYYPHAFLELKEAALPDTSRSVYISVDNVFNSRFEASNVIGLVQGENTDSTLVFTAHYDHLGKMGGAVFPGASDNASGVAMLLDLSAYYTENTPQYNTVFIAFAGEEAGLLGSHFFVEHPMLELNRIKLLINLDLMGSARDGITVVNGTLYPHLIKNMQAINSELQLLPKIKLRGEAANSDHYWFSEKGVPAFFIYTLGSITAYHDIYDTPKVVDFANYGALFTLITNFVETL